MPPKRERKSKKIVALDTQIEATPIASATELPAVVPVPVTVPVAPVVPGPVAVAVAVPIETKKKGKKQPKIVAMVTPDGIQGTFQSEPRRPLIAHLQINPSNVQFLDSSIKYDPNPPTQPEPYEPGFDNYFTNMNETLGSPSLAAAKEIEPTVAEPMETQTQPTSFVEPVAGLPSFVNHELMVEYREPSSQRKIPAKTDIACYWCVHSFETTPCILPEREEDGVYKVYGNFCCPECGLAYLLEESLDATTRWERMALLHRIYGPALNYKRIFPAPSRSTLKMFGGPMSIQTYRKTIREGKVRIDIQMPPMVSILGSLDTKPIDFYDSSLRNTFSPLLQENVPKAEENLRLKRTKPLKDRESTLDSVMNIQIKLKKAGGMGLTA